jgi:hypothetical protein
LILATINGSCKVFGNVGNAAAATPNVAANTPGANADAASR